MKLSERMRTMTTCEFNDGSFAWNQSESDLDSVFRDVEALEAELDSERHRAQDLAARLDRERTLRMHAEATARMSFEGAFESLHEELAEAREEIAVLRRRSQCGVRYCGDASCEDCEGTEMSQRLAAAAIPPVALEASDGGNRQAEAAERPLACSECGTRISADVIDALGFAIGSEMGCGACGERAVCVMAQCNTVVVEGPLPEFPRDEDEARDRIVRSNAEMSDTISTIASTLACDRSNIADAVRLLVTAHEACKRERDTFRDGFEVLHRNRDNLATQVQAMRTHFGTVDEVASLTARLERAETALREAQEVATRNATDCAHLRQSAIALTERAERAEAERDNTAAALLMIGSELAADPKIDPRDAGDPRHTPALRLAAEMRAERDALAAKVEQVRGYVRDLNWDKRLIAILDEGKV